MKGPIAPEWEEINSALEGKNENDILQQRLSKYLQAIKLNETYITNSKSHGNSNWYIIVINCHNSALVELSSSHTYRLKSHIATTRNFLS